MPKNKKHITTEYETILSKEIVKLREDNKKLMNEINDIKNMIELNIIRMEIYYMKVILLMIKLKEMENIFGKMVNII